MFLSAVEIQKQDNITEPDSRRAERALEMIRLTDFSLAGLHPLSTPRNYPQDGPQPQAWLPFGLGSTGLLSSSTGPISMGGGVPDSLGVGDKSDALAGAISVSFMGRGGSGLVPSKLIAAGSPGAAAVAAPRIAAVPVVW